MTSEAPFEARLESPAKRALADQLPLAVAVAANAFIFGPLVTDPFRVGKPLKEPLKPLWSARRGEYRVLYLIDASTRRIRVRAIQHRRDAYR